jgi:hypothetical protein
LIRYAKKIFLSFLLIYQIVYIIIAVNNKYCRTKRDTVFKKL